MKTSLLIQTLAACLVRPSPSVRRFSLTPGFSWVRLLSLTPCFSSVWQRPEKLNRFNGFSPLGFALVILSLLGTSAHAQQALDPKPADSSLDSSTQIVAETPYAVIARDGNQKIWSRVTWESNSLTGDLTAKTNSFIELATASAHLVNGAWVDSSDQIEITKTGAQATNSQHQVSFLGNINSSSAIDLTLPEGDKHLARFHHRSFLRGYGHRQVSTNVQLPLSHQRKQKYEQGTYCHHSHRKRKLDF